MNYTELQARVLAVSNRPDLSADIPAFIALIEPEIEERLTNTLLEKTSSVTVLALANTVNFPVDLLKLKSASVNGREIVIVTKDSRQESRFKTLFSSRVYASIEGRSLRMERAFAFDSTVELFYKSRIERLSGTVSTNPVLTYAEDLYQYGALRGLFEFIQDEARMMFYGSKFDKAMALLNDSQAYIGLGNISEPHGVV